jgi:hypothetical protein
MADQLAAAKSYGGIIPFGLIPGDWVPTYSEVFCSARTSCWTTALGPKVERLGLVQQTEHKQWQRIQRLPENKQSGEKRRVADDDEDSGDTSSMKPVVYRVATRDHCPPTCSTIHTYCSKKAYSNDWYTYFCGCEAGPSARVKPQRCEDELDDLPRGLL